MLNNECEQTGEEVIQQSTSSFSLINNLNNDCLAKVFKNLSFEQRLEIETVCKHWKEASEFAWDDITALNFTESSCDPNDFDALPLGLRNTRDIGRILKKCGVYLKELHIGSPCHPIILSIVSQYCSNLRKLNLSFTNRDIKWNQFLPFMEKLESLKIEDYPHSFPPEIFESLPETLTELEIPRSEAVGSNFPATTAFKNMKHLRHLNLTYFSLDSSMMEAIGQKTDLTHLDLRTCYINVDLTALLQLKNLQHLYLHDIFSYPGVNDNFVIQLADTCKNLNFLCLSGYFPITDNAITSLQKLTQLQELNLSCLEKVTDGPLGRMFQLKKLNCKYCGNVGDTGIIRLMKNAAKLEEIILTYCHVTVAIVEEALEVTKERGSLPLKICIDGDIVNKRDLIADKLHSPLLTLAASC